MPYFLVSFPGDVFSFKQNWVGVISAYKLFENQGWCLKDQQGMLLRVAKRADRKVVVMHGESLPPGCNRYGHASTPAVAHASCARVWMCA